MWRKLEFKKKTGVQRENHQGQTKGKGRKKLKLKKKHTPQRYPNIEKKNPTKTRGEEYWKSM